ncbi:MAG: ABC transporter permease [Chloroflexi bacterium]|nr:ABC transporter permease [Chloroflexota bacterium]
MPSPAPQKYVEAMILKNLWRRKTRTFLTTLGIAVGVASVVALSAFGEGMASGLEGIFSSTEADLTLGQKDAVMLLISAVDERLGDEIDELPGVAEVAGTVVGVVQMPESPYFIVVGEEPQGFMIQHYKIIAGSPLSGRKQILLGRITAENFDKEVGESFRLNDVTYRVVGIYETGVSMEDGGAVMSLDDAQGAFDKQYQVNYFNVKLKDPRQVDEVKKQIEAGWPDFSVIRSGESTQETDIYNLYRSFGLFLGIFAVAMGGLGMMNTTLMSVLERTREIGVLRAVGWRRRRIIIMILGESLALGLAGGVLGIALGVGMIELARLSPQVESLLGGVYKPVIFIQAIAIALTLGAVGGLYPSWRASQLAPAEAMRYDTGAGVNLGAMGRATARLVSGNALRNLFRRPTRTLVTLAGLGIGVGFVVALIAMVDGIRQTFTELATLGQVDLMAEQAGVSDASLSVIDERTADRIAARPEIKSISKIVLGFSTAPGLTYFMVFGLDPAEPYVDHYRIREGRMIQRSGEIAIGRFAANGLKKEVGDTLRVAGESFTIVGIFENGQAYEDSGGAIILKDAQRLFNKRKQVSFLGISVNDPSQAGEIARQLEREYPDIIVSEAEEMTERMQDFATTEALLNTLVTLIVIVGGIVMMNAMLMSVFERTQEIGVLRALGWRKGRVVTMVLIESVALSLLSGVVGIGFGMALNSLLAMEPTMGSFLTAVYTPKLFAQVLLLVVALGVIGGVYPAWRAAGLRPIEALRYE